MARPTELTVTYSRKNNLGDYSNEDVFLAVKIDIETGDDIRAVADEYFAIICDEVDRNSAEGARAIVRKAHGNNPKGAGSPEPAAIDTPECPSSPRVESGPDPAPQRASDPSPQPPEKGAYTATHTPTAATLKRYDEAVDAASRKAARDSNTPLLDAIGPVKMTLGTAFTLEWGKPFNGARIKDHTQGEVEWCIDWLKTNYAQTGGK